ncbi:hypothetical protein ACHAQJ_008763 [Trichoderma viride]
MDAASKKPAINTPTRPLKRVAPRDDLLMPRQLRKELDKLAYNDETGPRPNDMDEDEERAVCETIMRGAFYLVGVNPDAYPVCLEACVEKAMCTRLLFTSAWSSWGGYKSLKAKMRLVQEFTDSTKQIHCPPAPVIMAVVALKRIRFVSGSGMDESTKLMEQYKTSYMAPTAIHNYVGHEERLICIMYRMARQATEQDEHIAESLREVSLDVDCFRSSNYFQSSKSSNATTRLSIPNELDDDEIGESETLTVEVAREITREQAEEELKDILNLLKKDKDTSVTEEMGKRITLEHMKVLAPVNKSFVRMWAKIVKDDRILGFFEQSPDDLDKYTWTEMVKKPVSVAWSTHPAYAVWNEAKELVNNKGDGKRILKRLDMLRDILVRQILEEQANKFPDSQAQKQTDELREEITAIKGHLANAQKQTDELREEITAIKGHLANVHEQNGNLKRQNDEVIQLLKEEKRLKGEPVFPELEI